MRKKNEVLMSVCLLVSATAIAGPVTKTYYAIPGGSTKETAVAFVKKYDEHLYKGMSLKNLQQYWADSKIKTFKSVAKEITMVSGSSEFVDRQRLLDVEHANARCEKAELVDVQTTWKISRKAKLKYSVRNTCKDWVKPWSRRIAMKYSRNANRWYIQSIINSEK